MSKSWGYTVGVFSEIDWRGYFATCPCRAGRVLHATKRVCESHTRRFAEKHGIGITEASSPRWYLTSPTQAMVQDSSREEVMTIRWALGFALVIVALLALALGYHLGLTFIDRLVAR